MKKEAGAAVKQIVIALFLISLSVLGWISLSAQQMKQTPVRYFANFLSYNEKDQTVQMQTKLPNNDPRNDQVYTVDLKASGGIDTDSNLIFRQKKDPNDLDYPYFVEIFADTLPPDDTTQVLVVKYIESATT